jgi:hypothetical protein
MISYFCLILYFYFQLIPILYPLSAVNRFGRVSIQNSSFRDNFGIRKRAPDSKCRPVLQCAGRYFNVCLKCRPVLQVPIKVPNTNLKCRPVLQNSIKVPAGTSSFKQTFSASFLVFIRLLNVVPLFMINNRYNSDLNLLKIFELIYFN